MTVLFVPSVLLACHAAFFIYIYIHVGKKTPNCEYTMAVGMEQHILGIWVHCVYGLLGLYRSIAVGEKSEIIHTCPDDKDMVPYIYMKSRPYYGYICLLSSFYLFLKKTFFCRNCVKGVFVFAVVEVKLPLQSAHLQLLTCLIGRAMYSFPR